MSSSDPSAVRLCEIRDAALDVAEVLEAVEDCGAGGVNVFIGKVRDHDGGRSVLGLDYSAHPTASERMREVCHLVAARHEVAALAAVHRVGSLQIGDVAVVVATSGAHRGDTFAATRDLIDTLKAEVPIWKRQRFDDGDQEWVGTP